MTSIPGKDFLTAEAATLAAGVSAVIASPEYQVILRRWWSEPWRLNSTDRKVNPLPRVPCLHGGDTDLFGRLSAVIARYRYTVKMADAPGGIPGANGCTCYGRQVVEINPRRSPLQRAKTLAHEIAHVSQHAAWPRAGEQQVPPGWRELEAETCCWLMLRWLGIDSSSFSYPYIAKYGAVRFGAELRTDDPVGRAVANIADLAWWVTLVLPPAPAGLLAGAA